VVRQYAALTAREVRLTVRHLAFVVLALATVANLNSNFLGNVRGQHVHPRTGFFLQHALNDSTIVILLTVFFAGVLVWRERGHRTHEILDSQAIPNAVLYGSKLSALLLMQVAYALVVVGYGIFVQLALYAALVAATYLLASTLLERRWAALAGRPRFIAPPPGTRAERRAAPPARARRPPRRPAGRPSPG